MVKWIKNNKKNILAFIFGALIIPSISVYATLYSTSNEIIFSSSKTSKTNIQEAIDELYSIANETIPEEKSKCPEGYECRPEFTVDSWATIATKVKS